MKYRSHSGGIELFRAYLERRKADKDKNDEREKELNFARSQVGHIGHWVSLQEVEGIRNELVWLHVLSELDLIVDGILQFCENMPHEDDQLRNLRKILRIAKGNAPYDSALTEKQWEVEQLWVTAYLEMQKSRKFRSQSRIAAEISQQTNVSKTTAINHWKNLMKRLPLQEEWANNIISLASK